MSADLHPTPPRTPLQRWLPALAFGAAFLLLSWIAPYSFLLHNASGRLTPPAARLAAPAAFTLRQLDGQPWTLADHRGHVVLVNFWATWCPPCRHELPGLAALASANAARPVNVLGITLDQADDATVLRSASRDHLTFPIARPDPAWRPEQIPSSIPTTLLIDPAGRIARVYTGPVRRADFQSDIDELLRENPAPSTTAAALQTR